MKIKNASPSFVEYQVIKGTYGKVTYFLTKTTLRDVAENLTLAPQSTLTFSERIQRIVNEARVMKDILPYLENNELRFFNALVCLLLPDKDEMRGFWDFTEYLDDDNNTLGGIGKLKITKDVARVVLDGQHRFEALKAYWNSHKNDAESSKADIEVALVIIVADNIGIMKAEQQKDLRKRTIVAARNLFAVLNKTARPVDRTTLLLVDDSDLANVITRRLVEEKRIDELYIKWTGGDSLQSRDPYFTTLHVIKDAVRFYLRDYISELEMDYGSGDDREKALVKFYEGTPGVEVSLKDGISKIISANSAFLHWLEEIKRMKISIELQPQLSCMSSTQSKHLESIRSKSLAYTVAGQKALFRAMIETFFNQKRRDSKALDLIISRGNKLLENNLLSRKLEEANPFLNVLFDLKGRITWAEGPVDCARQIIAVALGSEAAQEPIIDRYCAMTNNPKSILDKYWGKAWALNSIKTK